MFMFMFTLLEGGAVTDWDGPSILIPVVLEALDDMDMGMV